MISSAAAAATTVHAAMPVPAVPLRYLLRTATEEVHQRLHRHRAFVAIQEASITISEYRDLLARLYGFYIVFERAAQLQPQRTQWLALDLATLGLDSHDLAVLPRCAAMPRFESAAALLGGLYVVEGSALGGHVLGACVQRLWGWDVTRGRRFFHGDGPGSGAAWKEFLVRLDAVPDEAVARSAALDGALQTFAVFEAWLGGWARATHE